MIHELKLNPFQKKQDETEQKPKNIEEDDSAKRDKPEEDNTVGGSTTFSGTGGSGTHKILRGFYVSEKASLGGALNQYTFRIFEDANKSEIKKEVSRLFNVKIKSVKILNMPEKRRDFGRHLGYKSGYKKAIIVLEEGYTIGQAKP